MRAHEFLFEYADINSPEFRAWFGNSKVVDAQGEPLVCYHGTEADFDEFDPSRSEIGTHFATHPSTSRYFAGRYGGRIIPVYLHITNPHRISDHGGWDVMDVLGDLQGTKAITLEQARPLYRLAERKAVKDKDRCDGFRTEFDGQMNTAIIETLEQNGIDGLVYKNVMEGGGDSYIIFRPDQARSVFSFTH